MLLTIIYRLLKGIFDLAAILLVIILLAVLLRSC